MKFKKGDKVRFTPRMVAEYKYLQEDNSPREVLGYDTDEGSICSPLVVLKSISDAPDCCVLEKELMLYPEHDQNDNPNPNEIKKWLSEEEGELYQAAKTEKGFEGVYKKITEATIQALESLASARALSESRRAMLEKLRWQTSYMGKAICRCCGLRKNDENSKTCVIAGLVKKKAPDCKWDKAQKMEGK